MCCAVHARRSAAPQGGVKTRPHRVYGECQVLTFIHGRPPPRTPCSGICAIIAHSTGPQKSLPSLRNMEVINLQTVSLYRHTDKCTG